MNTAALTLAALARTVQTRRDHPAVCWADGPVWRTRTWYEIGLHARHLALGLSTIGVAHRDRVALVVGPRPEALVARLAVMASGAVAVTVDPHDPRAAATAARAGVGTVIADTTLDGLPSGARLVTLDDADGGAADRDLEAGYGALLDLGADLDAAEPDRFERTWQAVGPDDLAAVVPVGESLAGFTHGALDWAVRSFDRVLGVGPHDRILSVLAASSPLAPVAEALLTVYGGGTQVLAGHRPLREALRGGEPTVVLAPPRTWAPVLDALEAAVPSVTDRLAPDRGRARGRLRALTADRLTRRARREAGLDGCRAALVVGDARDGAGDVPAVVERLAARLVPATPALAVDGLGAPASIAEPGRAEPGTLGGPAPGVTLGIDDDGHVAVRARGVAVTVDGGGPHLPDGWLVTPLEGTLDGGALRPSSAPAPVPAPQPEPA